MTEYDTMSAPFAETLRGLRVQRGLSQRELAKLTYVTQSTIARWENGNRLPDVAMITRLARTLGVDVNTLLNAAAISNDSPNVIMVEDRDVILTGGLAVLEEVMPNATVMGFEWSSEAIEYARENQVALAFLDIELHAESGLDLCRSLLDVHPRTNVVFLTAFAEYSLDAWGTGASGFMLKPITAGGVRAQLANLRYPFSLGPSEVTGE